MTVPFCLGIDDSPLAGGPFIRLWVFDATT